jgi:hypothetical protein
MRISDHLKTWWKAWGDLMLRLITLAGSLASLSALLLVFLPSLNDLAWWAVALLVVATLLLIVFVLLELFSRRSRRVFSNRDSNGIKQYMHRWIQHGGRVAIWTRDMSWAQNADTRRLMQEKAAHGELILCLPELNEFAKELDKAGAEVCAYGSKYLESPASRFTIIFFGRDGSQVAVGHAQGDTHVIDEFDVGNHPAFYLAEDLIALVRAQCGNRRD